MLCECHVMATLPAKDIVRARQFYEDVLGFDVAQEGPDGILYHARGSAFFLYPSTFAGTNQATAVSFQVDDLPRLVDELRGKGVSFQEYDMPGLKTSNGIAEMPDGMTGAWFTDTEGNIISLTHPVRTVAWPKDEVLVRAGMSGAVSDDKPLNWGQQEDF